MEVRSCGRSRGRIAPEGREGRRRWRLEDWNLGALKLVLNWSSSHCFLILNDELSSGRGRGAGSAGTGTGEDFNFFEVACLTPANSPALSKNNQWHF